MRQERIRKPNPHSKGDGAVPCTHQEIYECVQQEIGEHHTQAAYAFYSQRECADEQHKLARENGANGFSKGLSMNISREKMLDEICQELLINSSSTTEEEKESDRRANRAIYSHYSDEDLSETYRRLKNQIEMGR